LGPPGVGTIFVSNLVKASFSIPIASLTKVSMFEPFKAGQFVKDVMLAVAKANLSLQGVIDIVDFNATVSGQRIIEDGRLSTLIEILSRIAWVSTMSSRTSLVVHMSTKI
jgi:hypothetical protein